MMALLTQHLTLSLLLLLKTLTYRLRLTNLLYWKSLVPQRSPRMEKPQDLMGFHRNYSNVQLVQSVGLYCLFLRVWRTGHVLVEWRDGITVTLYKGKWQRTDCDNYRPITLFSVPWTVFAHVLLGRIQPLFDKICRRQQPVFTAGRSTIDAILAMRLLSELHRKSNAIFL